MNNCESLHRWANGLQPFNWQYDKRVNTKDERLELESKMISTISHCAECCPSANWLGLFSPKEKICPSGLWLVNELYAERLSVEDIQRLKHSS